METPGETGDGLTTVEVAGRTVPHAYGDAAAEYAAVRGAAGVADRSGDRARVRLWGRDPVKMMQGLVTNEVSGAPEGQGVYAAMLTPKGRTVAELRIFRRTGADGAPEVLLELPREALAGTVEHLRKYVPPMFARWADVSGELGQLGVYGPRARQVVSAGLGAELPELGEDAFVQIELGSERVLVAGTRAVGGEEGYELFARAGGVHTAWWSLLERGAALGARPVGHAALETLRVEAGRPRYGAELSEEVIPTEAFEASGLMGRAVSFSKGCYTGQEVIVRIAHRGHVNRNLRGLLLGGAPAPAPRTPLFHPETGREVGWTATAVASPRLGETVALGYVRRELGPGATVRLGAADGPAARVAALPAWSTAPGPPAGGEAG